MIPGSFAKFAFAPKSFDQFDLWLGVFRHQNGHNVKAIFHIADAKDPPINLCRAGYLPLFTLIYISNNGRKLVRLPRLNLNKTKRFVIKSDDVDLAGDLHAFTVAAHRNLEI